ncbi:hypothetical protein BGZ46_000943, partial [Entomortierella lignicola]
MATRHSTQYQQADDSSSEQPIQEQRQDTFQRRPHFLRSITSPAPSRRDSQPLETNSTIDNVTSRGFQTTTDYQSSPLSSVASSMSSSSSSPGLTFAGTSQEQSHSTRAQGQLDQQQSDSQRTFSASSELPPLSPSSSTNISSNQSKSFITETLKENRWSKGLKLNWMPSFGSQSSRSNLGLEGQINGTSTAS